MRKLLFFTFTSLLVSCSTSNTSRNIASVNTREIATVSKDLTGTYLGVSQYKFGHEGPNKAASRIYLDPIPGKKGTYNAVLLEYVDLLKMAPKYIASNKLPKLSRKVGFLKHITQSIAAYRVIPGNEMGVYELWPLKVKGDEIVVSKEGSPRILTLSNDEDLPNALAGATISGVDEKQPKEIFFPKDGDAKISGVQHGLASFVYGKIKLKSTWRKKFLTGPYLAEYGDLEDVVLDLSRSNGKEIAEFKINSKFASLSEKKRKEMFTNEKSAFLKGKFTANAPENGMFLLTSTKSDSKTKGIVEGKIGLFIDIFDATEALNQDVVEVAFINPEDPEDFLMYYEHPENGEGKDLTR